MTDATLTRQERAVLDHLVAAWNAYQKLPNRSPSRRAAEQIEFQTAIHRAQDLVALRVARRADPDVWG